MLPDWFYAVGQVVSWVFMLVVAAFLIYAVCRFEEDRRRPARRSKTDV